MSLATKYRPKTLDDVVEQSMVVSILKNMLSCDNVPFRSLLFIGNAGCGKAQALTSKILTPNGFITMGEVTVGTEVFTGNGNIGKVSGIYPQGRRPVYEIRLQDGTSIKVSDNHLNCVYRYNQNTHKREDYLVTTKELIEMFKTSNYKLRIDIPSVDWNNCSELPIDPYLVGALLGDGSLHGNLDFSNSESDVVSKVDSILRRDWNRTLVKVPGDNVDYNISAVTKNSCKYTFVYKGEVINGVSAVQTCLMNHGYPKFDESTILRTCQGRKTIIARDFPEILQDLVLKEIHDDWSQHSKFIDTLDSLGLRCKAVDKFIPEIYLKTSRENRIRLLQGLYDTDGYTDSLGSTSFTTCSKKLSEDFAFLVRSLGIRDYISESPSRYLKDGEYIYTGSISYSHFMKIPNDLLYCTSEKHLNRRKFRQNEPMRNIVAIERVEDDICQCIMIDHPDHTYISDGFIPTHNTTIARCIANYLNDNKGGIIEVDAASNNGADSVRSLVDQAQSYPVGTAYKVFILDEVHSFSNTAWQVWLKCLEEPPAKSIFLFCTTNPEKIPETILSRVQTFRISKISVKGIHDRLAYVIDQENKAGRNITYTDDALNFIAKLANGGMRDSLTLLDKALAYNEDINSQNLQVALNLPNYDDFFELLGAYAKRDNKTITEVINRVYNSGVNFITWFQSFHSFVVNIMKYIFLQDINETLIPAHYQEKLSKYTAAHSMVCMKLANKLVSLNNELRNTQYLQEIALTYLCQPAKKV